MSLLCTLTWPTPLFWVKIPTLAKDHVSAVQNFATPACYRPQQRFIREFPSACYDINHQQLLRKRSSSWFQLVGKILVPMEIFPQLGMNMKNIWNHHLGILNTTLACFHDSSMIWCCSVFERNAFTHESLIHVKWCTSSLQKQKKNQTTQSKSKFWATTQTHVWIPHDLIQPVFFIPPKKTKTRRTSQRPNISITPEARAQLLCGRLKCSTPSLQQYPIDDDELSPKIDH